MKKRDALRVVAKECTDSYARMYAMRALALSGNEFETQILYVLSNTGGWKGETARKIKKILRA